MQFPNSWDVFSKNLSVLASLHIYYSNKAQWNIAESEVDENVDGDLVEVMVEDIKADQLLQLPHLILASVHVIMYDYLLHNM